MDDKEIFLMNTSRADFYIATGGCGNDSWSGTLREANAEGTDGPFATILRARDAVQELKKEKKGPITIAILVRGGTYYLEGQALASGDLNLLTSGVWKPNNGGEEAAEDHTAHALLTSLDAFADELSRHIDLRDSIGSHVGPIVDRGQRRMIAFQWLIMEKTRIADLLLRTPVRQHSLTELARILEKRYEPSLAAAMVPVISGLGLDAIAGKARDFDIPIAQKAMILSQLGLHSEAIPLYREVMNQYTGEMRLVCANNLAYQLVLDEDSGLDEALTLAEEAFKEARSTSTKEMTADTLALIHFRAGNLDQAKLLIDEALKFGEQINYEHPSTYYHCYQIYKALGDDQRSKRYLRLACALVGGPERFSTPEVLRDCIIGEDEIVAILNDWIASGGSITRLTELLKSELRPAFRNQPPGSEREVADRIETILRAAGFHPKREKEHVEYSLKTYVPDFVLPQDAAALEVKFLGRASAPKRIIAEINDDKAAYLTVYAHAIFLVYDLGFIADVERFRQGIEEVGVALIIVKH
jgi:tetratricopeptide (TPR) repeat protein